MAYNGLGQGAADIVYQSGTSGQGVAPCYLQVRLPWIRGPSLEPGNCRRVHMCRAQGWARPGVSQNLLSAVSM